MPLKVRLTAVTGEQKETVIPFMLISDLPSGVQFFGFTGRKFIHILIRSFMHFSNSFSRWFFYSSRLFIHFCSLVCSFVHSFISCLSSDSIGHWWYWFTRSTPPQCVYLYKFDALWPSWHAKIDRPKKNRIVTFNKWEIMWVKKS